jgi:Flp pilus assembly protein TadB
MQGSTSAPGTEHGPKVAELLGDIGKDMKTIASDELELLRRKLATYIERTVARASVIVLGVIVALIGLAMLCVVAVIALAPVISALWLRLLLMALVYIGAGASVAVIYSRRISKPDLDKQIAEVGETIDAVQRGLHH